MMAECVQVFLHPASTLHKTAPEWVVYSQLVQTDKRIYMSGMCHGLICTPALPAPIQCCSLCMWTCCKAAHSCCSVAICKLWLKH